MHTRDQWGPEIGASIAASQCDVGEYEGFHIEKLYVERRDPKTGKNVRIDLLKGVDTRNPEVQQLLDNILQQFDLDEWATDAEVDRQGYIADRAYEAFRDEAYS